MVRLTTLVLVAAFLLSGGVAPAHAGFDDTLKIYKKGDYQTAFEQFKELADDGNHGAQYYLGEMYRQGNGVQINLQEALKWYSLSSETNNAAPQYRLGNIYESGQAGSEDLKAAYMWYALASINGHGAGKQSMERVAERMSAAEIAEAKKMVDEWVKKHKK